MNKLFFIAGIIVIVILSASSFGNGEELDWNYPQTIENMDELITLSDEKAVVFYKHSYKCGLCHMIHDDFQSQWGDSIKGVELVFIEVNNHRELSDYLAQKTSIRHHSPQVIVLKKGKIVYTATHGAIKIKEIKNSILN